MAQLIPLAAVPSQTLVLTLDGQAVRLNVYQRSASLYMDVLVDDALVIGGVVAQDRNRIVRELYRGFLGDFAFIDQLEFADPVYTGIGPGGRWPLLYYTAAEVAA